MRGKPFQRGNDPRRNTKGRPGTKLALVRKRIRILLETESEASDGRMVKAIDRIIEKAIQLAIRGDDRARRWLFEQGFGRVKNGMDIFDWEAIKKLWKRYDSER